MSVGRVLSVASECVPLIKTGGLADVVGALPGALAPLGWEMRVLLPAYPGLLARLGEGAAEVWSDGDLFGGPARVMAGEVAGIAVLMLDAPHLYDRPGGPYSAGGLDHPDNAERFAALGWAAARIALEGLADGWRPDVVHAHDWQAGLAPAYLRYAGGGGWAGAPRSVMTIHNIAFQGWAEAAKLGALRLPYEQFHSDGLEYYGGLSTLKAGLVTADAITTVSPTYAEELMRPAFGMGLQGVIAARAGQMHGILNGIDDQVWDPANDPAIAPFSAGDPAGKIPNRLRLMEEFALHVPGPLAIVVSRLTDQKGIDLIPDALEDFIGAGGGLAVLGSGDPALEGAMRALETRYPGRVGVRIGYDEGLSHLMFAGADAVLVPSRFEPCGLTQMYGLRYGALPVVAATGGLADTVVNASPAALWQGAATGVVFHPADALGLQQALRRLTVLHADPEGWKAMVRRAMEQPLGWGASSAAYAALYAQLKG
ncbi:glycogen synthase GlgA [Acidimangrovimonas sediminis]|uniref:glycogen synthase GlgA n=1 Tax=Acidimangrovimonas sediminis TaxID=2056283 RepID=UPI000C802770|nr:glycogen synthase GlgA [Acidimangrovimonas sediminis]